MFFRRLRHRTKKTISQPPRRLRSPVFQPLEERSLLAVFNVPPGSDAGIQAAILAAQGNTDQENTIILSAGAYHRDDDGGQIQIQTAGERRLIIRGAGQDDTIIDADRHSRVFQITGTGIVLFERLTVRGGNATDGGGVYISAGTVTQRGAVIRDNAVEAGGAGLGGLAGARGNGGEGGNPSEPGQGDTSGAEGEVGQAGVNGDPGGFGLPGLPGEVSGENVYGSIVEAPVEEGRAIIVTAPGAGMQPLVKIFDRDTGELLREIMAYSPSFRGGVQVATGDVNGDGVLDIITAAGPGGGPQVRVFDGATGDRIKSFFAYANNFTGGVSIASGDFNGDGKADIVTTPGRGMGPQVKIFDSVTGSLISNFFAYEQAFTGGIHVAVGDTNGDGAPEVITAPDRGGSSQVRIFTPNGQRQRQIIAYPNFTGGVWLAAGDIDGDGRDDIVTGAGVNGGPQVRTFSGLDGHRMSSFFAYANTFRGGVRVAAGDFDNDGKADILTGPGSGMTLPVRTYDGQTSTLLTSFEPYAGFQGGMFVAASAATNGQPLHARAEGTGGASLEQEELDAMLSAALSQSDHADLLRQIPVRNADLPGTQLGLAWPDEVVIDVDAAGHGWSSEGIDLLLVLAHEFGHVLGLDHTDREDELMSPLLSPVGGLAALDAVLAQMGQT